MPRLVPFALLAVAAACGSGQDPSLDGTVPSSSEPSAGSSTEARAGVVLEASLEGRHEAASRGDADGSGSVRLSLVPERSEVCYEIDVEGIGAPTGAHLHEGPPDGPGAVVLDVSPPRDAEWSGCAAANQVLLERLAASPSDFYVKVHNEAFPNGALRGRLE